MPPTFGGLNIGKNFVQLAKKISFDSKLLKVQSFQYKAQHAVTKILAKIKDITVFN